MTTPDHPELDNLEKLDTALRSDVEHWLALFASGSKDQLARRSFVRAVFALVEGLVFCLKRVTIQFSAEGDGPLTAEEVALLSEKQPELDKDGEIIIRPTFLKLKSNLQFAFKRFSTISNAGFTLDVSNDGWEKLGRSIKIRDRLMHPKDAADLEVSDQELEIVIQAYRWFERQYYSLWENSVKALEAESKASQRRAEELEAQVKVLRERVEDEKRKKKMAEGA